MTEPATFNVETAAQIVSALQETITRKDEEITRLRASMQGIYAALGEQQATGTIGSIRWYRDHWYPAWDKFVAALKST